jgi:hypothetical protein
MVFQDEGWGEETPRPAGIGSASGEASLEERFPDK